MILLHKTLFNIEGLGRPLYPQLDLWKTAHPVLKQWMDEQVGGRALLKDVRDNLPQLRDALSELPTILNHLGEQAASGRIRFNLNSPELREIQRQLDEQRRQRYWLAAAATSTVSGALVVAMASMPWLGLTLLGLGAVSAWVARP